MSHDREPGGAGSEGAADAPQPRPAGKATRVATAYPTLARAMPAGAAEPSIHDAATAAVEGKDGGSPVDPDIAARVGGHLGADLSTVRVHADPLAREASQAMGARAFAHGSDVFLGDGESPTDLGLMAHELTHVVQQGAAGQRAPQRKVEVGDANSPAEHEADRVAADVTAGAAPSALLVDDGPVAPGQMLKSTFIAELRAQVTAAADEELGPIYSAVGCPYIDSYFQRYTDQPAASGEALLRRFAPTVRSARDARDMIPRVVERVRAGVRHWRDTGQPPPDLAAADPAAAAASTAATSTAAAPPGEAAAARDPAGLGSLASLEAELGPGQPLDGATASRMSEALGGDVGAARIHTGPIAAAKAAAADAVAFAVGPHVVLGADAPSAGSIEGDALLAHELAHVQQQASAASDPAARRQPIAGEAASAEDAADAVATHAVVALHGDAAQKASLAQRADLVTSGLQLQRCGRRSSPAPAPAPGAPAIPTTHGADQRGTATLPTPNNATEIGYDLDPSSRPVPVTPPPPVAPGVPAPAPAAPAPRVPWDGATGAPGFAANRTALETALRACITGYLNDTRAQVVAAMGNPTVSYATTPASGATPANPGVLDIANAAGGVLESRYGGAMDAAAATTATRHDRAPLVQGTSLFDPHSAADRGALMGGQNPTQLAEGVIWWIFQNDNPSTAQGGRRACTQELEAHHYSTIDAGAEAFRWDVARNYVAAASAADRQRIIDYRLYNWSERGSAGITLLNSYATGPTAADTARNERVAHWSIFFTAIHELLHRRTHPMFRDATQSRAVMSEGFTEMFTQETIAAIVPLLRSGAMEPVRIAVEGNVPIDPSVINIPGTPAEYAEHLRMAQRIRDGVDAATAAALGIPVRPAVGAEGCRAAYFEGHVEYLGLSTGTGGLRPGDPLPAADLAPASGSRPVRVPPGMTGLADLATRANLSRAAIEAANPGITDALPPSAILPGCREHWVVTATSTASTGVVTTEAETRAGIAAQHGVSEAALARANPDLALDPATNAWPTLTLGQKILIPHP
jgi:hypothetical protein